MAFRTLWNAAVFFRMAGGAFLLRMLADLSLQAGCNLGMAQLAAAFKLGRSRDGYQWLVRVGMAVQTLCHRFRGAVGCIMAAAALRHNFRVIVSQRVIGMKYFMTFGAGNCLVPGAIIPQPVVMCGVAAGTFLQGERLHLAGINAALNCFCSSGLTEDRYSSKNHCQEAHFSQTVIGCIFSCHAVPLVNFQIFKKLIKKWQEPYIQVLLPLIRLLFDQEMRIHMTVKTVGHFLMHDRRMRLTMTGLALGYIRMLSPVAESTGECLVLGHGFFHLFADFPMARHAEGPRRGHGRVDLQRMMRRMAAKAVAGQLACGMGLMTLGTIRDLAVDLVTEGTGLLCMVTLIIGEILARSLMTGKAGLFYISVPSAGPAVHAGSSGRIGSFPVHNATCLHGTWSIAG